MECPIGSAESLYDAGLSSNDTSAAQVGSMKDGKCDSGDVDTLVPAVMVTRDDFVSRVQGLFILIGLCFLIVFVVAFTGSYLIKGGSWVRMKF